MMADSTQMETSKYFCDPCGIPYPDEQALKEHHWSMMHHIRLSVKGPNVHTCSLCFTTCTSLKNYGEHLNGKKHKNALDNEKEFYGSGTEYLKKSQNSESSKTSLQLSESQSSKNKSHNNSDYREDNFEDDMWGKESKVPLKMEPPRDGHFVRPPRDGHFGPPPLRGKWQPPQDFHPKFGGHRYAPNEQNHHENWNGMDRNWHGHHRGGFNNWGNYPRPPWQNDWGFQRQGWESDSGSHRHKGDWEQGENNRHTREFQQRKRKDFRLDLSGDSYHTNYGSSKEEKMSDSDWSRNSTYRYGSSCKESKTPDPSGYRSASEMFRSKRSQSLDANLDKVKSMKGEEAEKKDKDSQEVFMKTSEIINNILHKKTSRDSSDGGHSSIEKMSSSLSAKTDEFKSLGVSYSKTESKDTDKGSYLLKRAQNLCQELRSKRQLASHEKEKINKTQVDMDKVELDNEIARLADKSKSRMRGYTDVESYYHQSATSSVPSTSGGMGSSDRFSHKTGTGEKRTDNKLSDYGKQAMMPPAVKKALSKHWTKTPKETPLITSGKSGNEKDKFLKLINSPRSRKDKLEVAKIMQNAKLHKHRPKLSLQTASDSEEIDGTTFSGTIDFENLPDDIRLQIDDILDEEMNTIDLCASEPEEDTNDPVYVLDSDEGSEMRLEHLGKNKTISSSLPDDVTSTTTEDVLKRASLSHTRTYEPPKSSFVIDRKPTRDYGNFGELEHADTDQFSSDRHNVESRNDTEHGNFGALERIDSDQFRSGRQNVENRNYEEHGNFGELERIDSDQFRSDRHNVESRNYEEQSPDYEGGNVPSPLQEIGFDEVAKRIKTEYGIEVGEDTAATFRNKQLNEKEHMDFIEKETRKVLHETEMIASLNSSSTFVKEKESTVVKAESVFVDLSVVKKEPVEIIISSDDDRKEKQIKGKSSGEKANLTIVENRPRSSSVDQFKNSDSILDKSPMPSMENRSRSLSVDQFKNSDSISDKSLMPSMENRSGSSRVDQFKSSDSISDRSPMPPMDMSTSDKAEPIYSSTLTTQNESPPKSASEPKEKKTSQDFTYIESSQIKPSHSLDDSLSRSGTKRRRNSSSDSANVVSSTDQAEVTDTDNAAKKIKMEGTQVLNQSTKSDISMSSTASKSDCVDKVFEISLREEEVRKKLKDTDKAIEKMEKLIKTTQDQLAKRREMKHKLKKEEKSLIKKRMKLLKGAVEEKKLSESKNSMSSQQDSNNLTNNESESGASLGALIVRSVPDSERASAREEKDRGVRITRSRGNSQTPQTSEWSADSSKNSQAKGGLMTSNKELKTVKVKQEPSSDNCSHIDFSEPDTTTQKDDNTVADVPSLHLDDSCDSVELVCTEALEPLDAKSDFQMEYVGSIEGGHDSAFLKQIAVDFADLKQASYMFLDESFLTPSEEEGENGLPEKEDMSVRNDNQTNLPTSVGEKCDSFKIPQQREKSKKKQKRKKSKSDLSQSDTASVSSTSTAIYRNSNSQNPQSKEQSSRDVSINSIKSKKEVSQFYPDPKDNAKKKLKPRKQRDLQSSMNSAVCINSSSDACDDDDQSNSTSKQSSKISKKKKKRRSPDAKLLQEYLHLESSTDVEINDLETHKKNELKSLDRSVGVTTRSRTYSESSEGDRTLNASDLREDTLGEGKSNRLRTVTDERLKIQSQAVKFFQEAHKKGALVAKSNDSSGKFFHAHTKSVSCIVRWRGYIFTGSEDGTAKKFNLDTYQPVQTFRDHSEGIHCLHVSKYGGTRDRLFTGSGDTWIMVYDAKKGKQQHKIRCQEGVCQFHEAWGNLYIGLANGIVECYDLKKCEVRDNFLAANSEITCIASAKEGTRKLLLVGSHDCSISIRDAHSGLLMRSLEGHTKVPLSMKVVNHLVYSGSADKTLQVHNVNTGDLVNSLTHKGTVECIVQCHDNNMVLTGGSERIVRIYSCDKLTLEQMYMSSSKITSMMIFKKKIFIGNQNGGVEIKEITPEKRPCRFGHCNLVFGFEEDLRDHIEQEHALTMQPMSKCLWNQCYQILHDPKEAMHHIEKHLIKEKTT